MTDPRALAAHFTELAPSQKRVVLFDLAAHAVAAWEQYADLNPSLSYIESVVGTRQVVDRRLPIDALQSARLGVDLTHVEQRYLEPIAALQDDDLVLPSHIQFAYYSIYNLFKKYVRGAPIDDWLIVNQAISAELDLDTGFALFSAVLANVKTT